MVTLIQLVLFDLKIVGYSYRPEVGSDNVPWPSVCFFFCFFLENVGYKEQILTSPRFQTTIFTLREIRANDHLAGEN